MKINSKYDITKKTAPKDFIEDVNTIVKTRLEYDLIPSASDRAKTLSIYQLALEQMDENTRTWNMQGYKGEFHTVTINNVPITLFTLPAFDNDSYLEFYNALKAGIDVQDYMRFQRLYNANKEVSTQYIKQLWAIIRDIFDLDKVEEIVVWYDPASGKFVVIDGGHTIILYMLLGINIISKLKVIKAKTYAKAINFYINQTQFKTSLNSFQTAVGRFVRKDPCMVDIFTAITDRNINFPGFELYKDNATLRSFDVLEKIYNDYGVQGVEFVLDVPKTIWGLTDKSITSKHLLNALYEIYEKCTRNKKSFEALLKDMANSPTASDFLKKAKGAIVDKYESGDGKSGEGPIVTYCKAKTGMIKLVPIKSNK